MCRASLELCHWHFCSRSKQSARIFLLSFGTKTSKKPRHHTNVSMQPFPFQNDFHLKKVIMIVYQHRLHKSHKVEKLVITLACVRQPQIPLLAKGKPTHARANDTNFFFRIISMFCTNSRILSALFALCSCVYFAKIFPRKTNRHFQCNVCTGNSIVRWEVCAPQLHSWTSNRHRKHTLPSINSMIAY